MPNAAILGPYGGKGSISTDNYFQNTVLNVIVTYFERNPRITCNSIERLFKQIRNSLPESMRHTKIHCPTPADTHWWLPVGLIKARSNSGIVNHIAGDIHYAALGLPSRRTIVTVCDLNHIDHLSGLRKLLFCWIYFKLPLRNARFVTAISEHTRDQLEKLIPRLRGKTVVIPCCIPQEFEPIPKAFNKACPRILQVGTARNKNLERVIEALADRNCLLHIVGKLNEGHVRLLQKYKVAYQNDLGLSDAKILNAYREADIVTFVSLNEGFGMPILEAQATGRAVLTSSRSPMDSVAGGGACKVDPENVDSIRVGLNKIIDDDVYREKLIQAGFTNQSRFSAAAIANQYAALYEIIAKEQVRRSR